MTAYGKTRPGIGNGAGRRWRGADGPGGSGGMFEGSEGPKRAAGGRYERRQTRQVLSALFLAPIRRILHRGADVAATHRWTVGGDRRCGWWLPPIPGHVVQRRSHTPEGGDLAGAASGPSPKLGHTRDAEVVQHGMVLGSAAGALTAPGAGFYIERAANWGRGEGGYRAGLSSRRPRVQVPSLPSSYQVLVRQRSTGCGAVASALGSGPRGREFKSPQPDCV